MEEVQLSYVNDLSPAQDFWNMKARIIRLWKQSYRCDMILLDEKGHKIQASVKIHLLPDFGDALKEDNVVLIRKFGVAAQKDKFRVIPLDYKVNFFKCTVVSCVSGFNGHPYGFNFISFTDIIEKRLDNVLTFDVIGRVASCGNLGIFNMNGRESRRMNFELEDLQGNVLSCTMWGSYADEFNSFVSNNTSNDIVIVIIQHGKFKEWNGKKTIQSDMFGTRLFINATVEEAIELRRSLITRGGATSSQTVLSSQTVYPIRNEFLLSAPRKHVDEIMEIDEEMTCIVIATVRLLEENHGWFYLACRHCQKKVYSKKEYLEYDSEIPLNFLDAPIDSLWCIKCKKLATALLPKYKVQIRVQDSTGSVSFVMFDTDVSKIVGLSATDVRARQLSSGVGVDCFPHELDVLKNKQMAFKVFISSYNLKKNYHVYTVSKVCEDSEIISELLSNDQVDQIISVQDEPITVKLEDCSQPASELKDAVSFTGDSVAFEQEKEGTSSPTCKRSAVVVEEECTDDQGSTTRPVNKKVCA